MKKIWLWILTILTVSVLIFIYYREGIISLPFNQPEQVNKEDFEKELVTKNGYGVSANHPLAVEAGLEILEQGGNAVDAAVAISYVLGVVEPQSSGIGGGGAMIIYKDEHDVIAHQYREMAPLSGMKPSNDFSIPGFVKGMEEIVAERGTMSHDTLMQPAIDLARKGVVVDDYLEERLGGAVSRIDRTQATPFFPQGEPLEAGDILKQAQLAETLETIQQQGSAAFYEGELASAMMESTGVAANDFTAYETVQQKPVVGHFQDFTVYSAPPPFAGMTLIQILQMMEHVADTLHTQEEGDRTQLLGEIIKKAYEARLVDIGDPLFEQIDIEKLTKTDHSIDMFNEIDAATIFESPRRNDTKAEENNYSNTTHFVVVDKDGMMVSATNTLTNFFGSGTYVEGFFLNNSLSNFSTREDNVNAYAPGKRSRTMTAPTILANDERLIGIGTPGGRRIPAMMSQVLYHHLIGGQSIVDAVEAPRFYMEDRDLMIEPAFEDSTMVRLQEKGYIVDRSQWSHYFGGVQALILENTEENAKRIYGAADSRRGGTWGTNE